MKSIDMVNSLNNSHQMIRRKQIYVYITLHTSIYYTYAMQVIRGLAASTALNVVLWTRSRSWDAFAAAPLNGFKAMACIRPAAQKQKAFRSRIQCDRFWVHTISGDADDLR